jgi:hypothetical protein
MRESLLYGLLVALVVGQTSCGDDAGGGGGPGDDDEPGDACEIVDACGGAIAGDWKISGVCYDEEALGAQVKMLCPDVTVTIEQAHVTGDISYKPDQTFVQGTTELDASAKLRIGASCLRGLFTCEQIALAVNSSGALPAQVACGPAAQGGCECSTSIQQTSMATGSYAVDGFSVSQSSADMMQVHDFCVKGSRLYLLPDTEDTASLPVRLLLRRK